MSDKNSVLKSLKDDDIAYVDLRFCDPRGNFLAICSNIASAGLLARFCYHFRRSVRFPFIPLAAPSAVPGPDMSDNWSFWEHGYPALMLTDTSFFRNPHYHQPSDRLETLHIPAMTRVVGGVIGAMARMAGELK